MILTDYYKFEKIALKSKSRIDCVLSTASYPEFESMRARKAIKATDTRDATNIGSLVVYCTDVPETFKADAQRKADMTLSKTNNISSIYVPDAEREFGFGDFVNTNDALLFVFSGFEIVNGQIQAGGVLEIFIARGKSKNCNVLYNLLTDGGLDDEMCVLRQRAVTELVTMQNSPQM